MANNLESAVFGPKIGQKGFSQMPDIQGRLRQMFSAGHCRLFGTRVGEYVARVAGLRGKSLLGTGQFGRESTSCFRASGPPCRTIHPGQVMHHLAGAGLGHPSTSYIENENLLAGSGKNC